MYTHVSTCTCLHVFKYYSKFLSDKLFDKPSLITTATLYRSLFLDNQYTLTQAKYHKWLRPVYVSVSTFRLQALWGQGQVLLTSASHSTSHLLDASQITKRVTEASDLDSACWNPSSTRGGLWPGAMPIFREIAPRQSALLLLWDHPWPWGPKSQPHTLLCLPHASYPEFQAFLCPEEEVA